eukprot:GHVU01198471.1.p1 GENE.GHVU01198471.1~~GHVU01198471.1.p1  ORF type:complete len:222 (-),score=48.95 GHVU01198471.1:251-916(-)
MPAGQTQLPRLREDQAERREQPLEFPDWLREGPDEWLLPFQRTATERLLNAPCLVVLARGLGVHAILAEFCRQLLRQRRRGVLTASSSSSASEATEGGSSSRPPPNLPGVRCVLLLGTAFEEFQRLSRSLKEPPAFYSTVLGLHLPSGSGSSSGAYRYGRSVEVNFVSYELPVAERLALYAKGGVIVASSRILVGDLLSGRLPPESIDAVVVNHAHRSARR